MISFCDTRWFSCRRVAVFVGVLAFAFCTEARAASVSFPLNAQADQSSNFITYWSEGIAQLNRTYPGTNNQPFWSTKDPTRTYNASFDFFPNDSAMRFGELTYDDSGLAAGSGVAAITGLVLGVEIDPLDPTYINGSWLNFTTDMVTYSGTVDVVGGEVTGVNLTANYTTSGYFGPYLFEGSGKFTVEGDRFRVAATASNTAYQPLYNPAAAWDWTGDILNLADPGAVDNADFNRDGFVDAADYTLWRDHLSATGVTPFTMGDANGDGLVTSEDYQVWRTQYGGPAPTVLASAPFATPEPAGALSVGVLALVLGLRRGDGTWGR